ncbi:hypothetical protein BC940DRAFT_318524 [Gongronella butleri]|nr:hypothetical protein BC940DRAFT_318524 [Gongronella butleri]
MVSPVTFETFQSILSLITQHYKISEDPEVTLCLFDEYKAVPAKKLCSGVLRSGAHCSANVSKENSFCKRHDPYRPNCQGKNKNGKECSRKVKVGTHCFQHKHQCVSVSPDPPPASSAPPPVSRPGRPIPAPPRVPCTASVPVSPVPAAFVLASSSAAPRVPVSSPVVPASSASPVPAACSSMEKMIRDGLQEYSKYLLSSSSASPAVAPSSPLPVSPKKTTMTETVPLNDEEQEMTQEEKLIAFYEQLYKENKL